MIALLLAATQIGSEMTLPPRTVPVPKVYWSCALRTIEDLRFTLAGETDLIPASKQNPLDVEEDVRVKVRIFGDSSGKLNGTHTANYIDMTNTFKMSVTRDSGTYFLTLEFFSPSKRSYAVLSFRKPNSMSVPDPIALGFCEHSPLEGVQ